MSLHGLITNLIGPESQGYVKTDESSINNPLVEVGMLLGTAYRTDDGSAEVEANTQWTIPMYTCATAIRASIADVSFFSNNTAALTNLQVTAVTRRSYSSDEAAPLWAVEKTGLTIKEIVPFWSIVDDSYASGNASLFTRRGDGLYLPAGYTTLPTFTDLDDTSAAAGAIAPGAALAATYASTAPLARLDDNHIMDYSGVTNYPFLLRWQQLTQSANSSSTAINLIWTDIMANYVVGTLSNLNRRNGSDSADITVRGFDRRVRYDLRYAIPAFIYLGVYVLVLVAALVLWAFRRATFADLRVLLNQTATARIAVAWKERGAASIEADGLDGDEVAREHGMMKTKDWIAKYGAVDIGVRKRLRNTMASKEKADIEGEESAAQRQGMVASTAKSGTVLERSRLSEGSGNGSRIESVSNGTEGSRGAAPERV